MTKWFAISLLLMTATTAFAEGARQYVVGPPVDHGARTLELRASQSQPEPMAYSFRIAVEDTKAHDESKDDSKDPDSLPLPATSAPMLSPAQQYCSNILDAASAAKVAQETRQLQAAQKLIDDKITLLTAKAEVLKSWMKLRQEFAEHATDSLVQIYSKMKPDSAAAQLAAMNEMTSAAIISKLNPKISSPILAEMEVAKAARLSAVIAGAGELALQPERKVDAQP